MIVPRNCPHFMFFLQSITMVVLTTMTPLTSDAFVISPPGVKVIPKRNTKTNRNQIRQLSPSQSQSLFKMSKQEESQTTSDTLNGLSTDSSNGSILDLTAASTLTNDDDESNASKYKSILDEVGLGGQISTLGDLSSKRLVSRNGVFCNRELKFGAIRAIGFDMDYTIAQYKQPAFDKLAFDGAKVCFMYVLRNLAFIYIFFAYLSIYSMMELSILFYKRSNL